ncbi:type II secretion system protein F [Halolactibacillus alkaliphilus]|uniref:Type II secretion system protein F n=1 Tax=Halolactibacillus alkaliphilus TaxID=442899 RepID=A0A511WY97_9BACI|nr:type II secretion system F family protein [Halolactibacillus alkaliphilus]GEN55987.1 type II secretion system protein F [Halolactibacillus alkaliphilus]GGN68232.1 type II secretion system protein F [Halolactibacillus alkaliphilus]SFO69415.1 type IV pilus assembly protein PilC [Halolactibacillus alkaliphilus]
MPAFRYQAVSSDGTEVEDVFNAGTRAEVIKMLKAKGYKPILIEEALVKHQARESISALSAKIKPKDLAIFCNQFATLIKAGVPVASALDILQQQSENKKLKQALKDVSQDVQKGTLVSQAMKKHLMIFPQLLTDMTESGEMSGNLDNVMARLAMHYEKESKIESKIKGAMVYPIVLSAVAVVVVIFMLIVVMPTFLTMFEGSGVPLPGPTRFLLGMSNALINSWYIVLVIVIGAFFTVRTVLRSEAGRRTFDQLKFRLPLIKGPMLKIVTSRFTRTLGSLTASGLPLIESLKMSARVSGNVIVEEKIMNMAKDVEKGEALGHAMRRHDLFPPMVVSMTEVGEESGSLEEMLDKSADFYDRELEDAIDRLLKLLEPMLILVMAVVIGFIVIAMMLPMFDMIQTI